MMSLPSFCFSWKLKSKQPLYLQLPSEFCWHSCPRGTDRKGVARVFCRVCTDRIRSATTPNVVLYEIRTFRLQVTENQLKIFQRWKKCSALGWKESFIAVAKERGKVRILLLVLHSKERRAVWSHCSAISRLSNCQNLGPLQGVCSYLDSIDWSLKRWNLMAKWEGLLP